GISQTIDMIDAYAVDQAFCVKLKNHCMRGIKYVFEFDAYTGQIAHFEKATPIDFLSRITPPGQFVILAFKQAVQAANAAVQPGIYCSQCLLNTDASFFCLCQFTQHVSAL